MLSVTYTCIRVSLRVLLLLFVARCLPAQEPQIDALADQMATSLSKAKLRTVLVVDFVGPADMDALGEKFAADFRAALTKSAHDLQVQSRSQLLELLKKNELEFANLHYFGTARWLVGQSDADVWIYGTLSTGIGGLKVRVDAYPLKNPERYFEFDTSVPLTDNLKALIEEKEKDEFSSLPRPGQGGYSDAACIYCPQVRYTADAVRHKLVGAVVLEFTIDTAGAAKDITVKVGLPYGMTQQAIETVKDWKMKPSTGPDEKPAAVRQEVELSVGSY
jgi:TonB family protein